MGAAISSANKPKSPKPGISVLPSNDVSSALKKLQKEPTKNTALINMIESAQSAGRPIFKVTTDGKKTLLQAQLSQENLAKAIAAVQANPNVYKGQSQYILQAMGLNKALAAGGTVPSSILRQHIKGIPDVSPPSQAVLQTANTALQSKIQAKMQPFLTAKGDLQSAQQRLQQSRNAAANAATVAQARYAKYITGVNQKNQRLWRSTISTCCRRCNSMHRSTTQLSPSKTFRLPSKPQSPHNSFSSTCNRAIRRKSKRTRLCRLNCLLDRALERLDRTAHALRCQL